MYLQDLQTFFCPPTQGQQEKVREGGKEGRRERERRKEREKEGEREREKEKEQARVLRPEQNLNGFPATKSVSLL